MSRPHGKAARRVGTAVAVTLGLIVAGVPTAKADATGPPTATVTSWVAHHATPLSTVDPKAALDDLAPLGRSVGQAQFVGLGESAHGAAEELKLKLRVLRFLFEERGFRSVAWEEDWATGRRIDRYIRGGAGDAGALVGQMLAQLHSSPHTTPSQRTSPRKRPGGWPGCAHFSTRCARRRRTSSRTSSGT